MAYDVKQPKPNEATLPPIAVHAANNFTKAVDEHLMAKIPDLDLAGFKQSGITLASQDATNNLQNIKAPSTGRDI